MNPEPWQRDTSVGDWHYNRPLYDKNEYKTAKTVIHTLIDVVSKNGNLLLNVPVPDDGTIDEKEQAIAEGIADWMTVNSEAIFGTRPWKFFGEGTAITEAAPLNAQGFNEEEGNPFTAEDIRFTMKGETLYAFLLGWPGEKETPIKLLGTNAPQIKGKKIMDVSLLGYKGKIEWSQKEAGLIIKMPLQQPRDNAVVVQITGCI